MADDFGAELHAIDTRGASRETAPVSDFGAELHGIDTSKAAPASDVAVSVKPYHANPLQKALEPITSYPSTYNKMQHESREQMAAGVSQMEQGTAKDIAIGAGKTALGAAGYITSPINAALRTVVGKPIEENTGIPKEYPEFAAGLMLPVPKNIPLGTVARAATKGEKVIPTTSELFAAGAAGRTAAKESGFVAPAEDVARLRDEFAAVSKEEGHAKLAPKTSGIMEDGLPVDGPMSAPELITLRRQLVNAGKNGGSEAQAAKDAKGILDKYMGENIPDANAANANFAAGYRSKAIDRAIDVASTTKNPGASIISQLRALRFNPKTAKGFSADETEKIDSILKSGVPDKLKDVGGFIGGAGDLRSWIAGSFTGGVAPVFGYGLRKIGNAITDNQVQQLSEMVRSNSPRAKAVSASLRDWSTATHAFEVDPSVRAMARVTIASRNLSNNLSVAGISVPPNLLIRAIKGPVNAATNQKGPDVQGPGQQEQ
jgi:hypothetical protein